MLNKRRKHGHRDNVKEVLDHHRKYLKVSRKSQRALSSLSSRHFGRCVGCRPNSFPAPGEADRYGDKKKKVVFIERDDYVIDAERSEE